ncbi:MAG: hypothetical protein ACXWT5_09730 [Methylophilus sp.]
MPITSTQTVEYKITSALFDLTLGVIILKVAKGYQDGANFITLSEVELPINQTDSTALYTTAADSTKDLYTNVKEALYNKLIADGIVTGVIV